MVRYYKLFDLLNRRGMKKSDLRQILAPQTVAKLSKGEYLSGEVIEKICLFLDCQPGDIMEVIKTEKIDDNTQLINKSGEIYAEKKPSNMTIQEADEELLIRRQYIGNSEE